jgi:signal transduction histidine kinase
MSADRGTVHLTHGYLARSRYHCEWIEWVTEVTAEQWGKMSASRGSKSDQALAASRAREPAAAILDFAVARILWDDSAPGALPAVLERLVTGFGLRAALAFQPSAGHSAAILSAYPRNAADPALMARIGALSVAHRGTEAIAPVQLALGGPDGGSALVAYSAPTGGRCLCALALIGDAAAWNEEIRVSARAVAVIVATQIRHQAHLAEQANRQRAEYSAELRKTDEVRNQFLGAVSHELRTPLTSIVSFIELIRAEAAGLTPEGLSFLDIIERNAGRMYQLIGDLLMLNRVEAGALPLDLAPVSVAELVTDAVQAAAPGAAKQGVTLEVHTDPGPPVQGDSRRLTQVLDNLIANAVKFSHRNSMVRISTACRSQTWRIDVADAGIGIPPQEADQLFSRFVRASNARTAGLPGSGLGLYIVKILVEMHGGNVQVRSTLGRGSTFSVFLPVAQ